MGEDPIDERAIDRLIEDVGDESARRLLRAFTRETRRRMARILARAGERNLTALRDECHTLKGAAGSFGAVAVERQASEIVAACQAGDSADALARVEDLRGLVDAALGALDKRLSSATGRPLSGARRSVSDKSSRG
ncbi:MAG: Hpt domain-containing protein [Proteobacteria bacterium]|nr:Hpt domain-containing protein [Pseudomonadota bacterium]